MCDYFYLYTIVYIQVTKLETWMNEHQNEIDVLIIHEDILRCHRSFVADFCSLLVYTFN